MSRPPLHRIPWLLIRLLITASSIAPAAAAVRGPYYDRSSTRVLHSFTVVDYDWHAIGISKGEALRRGQDAATAANQFRGAFIPKNNAITGLKWYGGDVFVTVPRWLPGVPSTLNKVIVNETCDGGTCTNVSLLQPYPMPIYNSTEPSKIKYVQSMEIDYENVMWILDVGRLNIADPATSTEGAAKLVLWDMEKNKQKGEEYEFPASVAPHNSTFLNDLMVDVPNQIAYISDAGNGAIVVVDMRRRVSVRFHGASTKRDPAYKYVVEGWDYGNGTATTPADGIALTPDRQWLYWCPCQGQQLYKVQTIYLQRLLYGAATVEDVRQQVVYVGLKRSNADGMAFAANGILYSGGNADPENAVWAWDPGNSTSILDKDNIAPVLWADTFAFDDDEHLLWTGNNLLAFFNDRMNFTNGDANFIIYQQRIYSSSYMTAQKSGETCSDGTFECWYKSWPKIHYWTILPALAVVLSLCIAALLRWYHKRRPDVSGDKR